LFKALRNNTPLPPAVGTTLVGAPVSEANITIPVIDHASVGKAAGVEQILSQGGFDISPGVALYGDFGSSVKGTVLAYSATAADQAAVVHNYFPNIPMKQVPASELGGNKVALFVTGAYEPVPVGVTPSAGPGTPTAANCTPPAS